MMQLQAFFSYQHLSLPILFQYAKSWQFSKLLSRKRKDNSFIQALTIQVGNPGKSVIVTMSFHKTELHNKPKHKFLYMNRAG